MSVGEIGVKGDRPFKQLRGLLEQSTQAILHSLFVESSSFSTRFRGDDPILRRALGLMRFARGVVCKAYAALPCTGNILGCYWF